ncbi:MAG: hypothetical protein JSV96_16230 [Candidatus Aminicenantes bacterium]|nr:MAG: hypothetical protein JSV96_16230 [Candidatus Aminicenantes bacterium]
MVLKKATDIRSSEITDKNLYMKRRKFIAAWTALISSGLFSPSLHRESQETLKVLKRGEYTVPEIRSGDEQYLLPNAFL